MTSAAAGELALRLLRQSPVFASLPGDIVESLAAAATPVQIAAGAEAMREGEPADAAYVVVTGRLRVTTRGDGSSDTTVADVGPGAVIGEMSLITGEPRSATVRAVRSSRLLRLAAADFERLVLADSGALLAVTRTIVRRLARSIHGTAPAPRARVVCVYAVGDRDPAREIAEALRRTGRSTVLLQAGHVPSSADGADNGAHERRIAAAEEHHDLVLLLADPEAADWTEACLHHCDLVLGVARRGTAPTELGVRTGDALARSSAYGDKPRSLVVVHPPSSVLPVGLAPWPVDERHHVREGDSGDIRRLDRILRGQSVGLVFGGGGARGFAHFGVVRALAEADIPVDHAGGASIGASVAAGVAMGLDWRTMLEHERRATVDNGSLIDFSFPAVALAAGRRLTAAAKANFGDARIEDLWRGFFCVSTDLTAGRTRVHAGGPLWRAVRASTSIPGIFPPMRADDGHVLVDGAVLDPLPVGVMRSTFHPGTIIAVDLQSPAPLPASDLAADGVVSGWRVLGRRFAPWKDRMDVPRMVDVLTSVSSVSGADSAAAADLAFRPPVATYGTLDFKAYEAIVEAGYRHAADVLEREGSTLSS